MNERKCREIVQQRSMGLCERCCAAGVTKHHRKNRSQGGKWTPENIADLCGDGVRGCHGWVTNHPAAASEQGWHVKPWEDPAEIPVLYQGSSWAYLTTEGTIRYAESNEHEFGG